MPEETHSALMPKTHDWSTTQDPSALTIQLVLRELASLNAVFDERFKSILVQITSIEKAQTLFETNLTRVPTDVDKAIGQLKELQFSHLQDIEKQLAHLQKDYDQFPALLNEKVEHLRPLFLEKFHSVTADMHAKFEAVQMQLSERDERVKQAALDTKVSIDAAMVGADKLFNKQNEANAAATSKSEEGFAKQIEQQRVLLQATNQAMSDRIDTMNRAMNDKIDTYNRAVNDKIDTSNRATADKIDALKELSQRTEGRQDQSRQNTQGNQWLVGAILGGLALLVTIIIAMASKFH